MKLQIFTALALVAGITSAQVLAKDVDDIIAAVLPKNSSIRLQSLFDPPSKSTPKYIDVAELNDESLRTPRDVSIVARQSSSTGDGTCAPGRPCSNGACCSKSGFCGYSSDFCGSSSCISNCDAKAQCGKYAVAGKEKCPLNVCCSQYGFCGTTKDFCGTGCDTTGGLCGNAPSPSGMSNALFRSIGYYESWANTRSCDRIAPEDLDTTGLTHLNFAFAFFHPTTFQITAMDSNAQGLLKRFTALKSNRLQTWISVGGWSFNDPGNNPDTRAAFSDMASTAANRKTFIDSLLAFMRNYGFDGVDIDWEYPAADDRGGKAYDKANFVSLVRDMKAAFAGKYGISITLPSSYWYLQHFDLVGMQPYVSFFNVMSYDLHGVWDSSNRNTGSFIRPHTNLTEIDEAMNLLWRAGVKASNVVLGLGFYGRSFTLTDSACTKPWTCKFSSGAKAGECSAASGILTAAEIGRIITKNNLTPVKDTKAAVKWISWDTNQWVSYDDEETFVIKLEYARSLGLSGTMVWALDQGVFSLSKSSTTLSQYSGMALLQRKGITASDIETVKVYQDAGDSCYTSFCNVECAPGYFQVYQMNGQVGQLGAASACKKGELQNLCCRSGTFLGRCRWAGYRGVGLSCFGGGGCGNGETLMAVNTNHYFANSQVTYKEDQTCNGGLQSYCCESFKPSTELGRGDAALLQSDVVDNDPNSIAKRDLKSCAVTAAIAGGSLAFIPAVGQLTGLFIAGAGILVCFAHENEAAARKLSGYSGPLTRGKVNAAAALAAGALPAPVVQPPKGTPKGTPATGQKFYGDYALSNLTGKSTCTTTYICRYGKGFDQVCDNQRYGLEKITAPNNVFTYDEGGTGNGRTVSRWAPNKNAAYRQSFGRPATGRNRCETDEFPMNSLAESAAFAQQALRSLDGNENGAQGNDFNFWLLATWYPCSTLLQAPPPITWAVPTTALPAADPRRASATGRVIAKYGFDSSSARDPCWATFTPASGASSVVRDHGFRVHTDDPLFSAGINWTFQNYRPDPNGLQAAARPTNVASAAFLKRGAEIFSTTITEATGKTGEAFATITGVSEANRRNLATSVPVTQIAAAS